MNIQLSATQWKGLRPALLIGFALAVLQIGSGVLAYYQSKNLLLEGKLQAAHNLSQGLVVAIADQVVLKDYASVEARMMQTMANLEVASVVLTDTSGKVLTYLRRSPGQAPHQVFGSAPLSLLHNSMGSVWQSRDEVYITTWSKITLGVDVGWLRMQTYTALDNDDLSQLRRQTSLLSALSVLSGSVILGLFLWRFYFTVVKREHFIEMKLDETSNRLLQSEKLASLGQLAAGVAHEINNPIGYVSSNIATLAKYLAVYEKVLDAKPGNETEAAQIRQRFHVDTIRADVQPLLKETQEGLTRVTQIVKDLKDFSRSNTSAVFVKADIFEGLRATLNIVSSEVKNRADVRLELGDTPLIDCVPSQINQVFLNLIVNAAQAMDPLQRGLIVVRSGHNDTQVWCEVEDNGQGMNPETLAKIFDPFFTTKAPGQGTGLGLSVSLGIVEKHGGTLTAHSTVGVGTRFRVVLPIHHHPSSTASTGAHA